MEASSRKPRVLVNGLSLGLGGGRSYIVNFLREVARDDRGFSFRLLALEGQLEGVDCFDVPVEEVRLPIASGPLRTPLRMLYEQVVMPRRARRDDLIFCLADICPMLGSTPKVVMMRNLNIYDRTWARSIDGLCAVFERALSQGSPAGR